MPPRVLSEELAQVTRWQARCGALKGPLRLLRRLSRRNRRGRAIEAATKGFGRPPEWNLFLSNGVQRDRPAVRLDPAVASGLGDRAPWRTRGIRSAPAAGR